MLNRKSTYVFLKKHENKTILGKEIPEDLDITLLQQINNPTYINGYYQGILDKDRFLISEKGKDFIINYELEVRPVRAAERANILSAIAIVISVAALIKSFFFT